MLKYILIADDEEVNRDILQEVLKDSYEVYCVKDGLDCIKSIEDRIPDLLLLDVAMPGMTGIEVAKKIRSESMTANIPIIMLSGYASDDDVKNGLASGANIYIAKPFDLVELLDAVKDLLSSLDDV